MSHRLVFPTLAGLLLLLTVSAPASAGHTDTHVEADHQVTVTEDAVYASAYVYVDCSPQNVSVESRNCYADAGPNGNPHVCDPVLGWGCADLF